MISFVIPGKPRGMKRARFARGITYDPQENKVAKAEIAALFRKARPGGKPTDKPVSMDVTICVALPKTRKPVNAMFADTRPDVDNVCKLIMDALNGVYYEDDKQVASLVVSRIWGPEPYTKVELSEV